MNSTKNKIMENIQKYKTDKKTHQLTSKKNISNFYEQETFIKLFQTFYNYVKPMYSIHAKKKTLYDLRFYIEEIYSKAFSKYMILVRKGNKMDEIEKICQEFCKFVFYFICSKINKKKFVDEYCMNLMLSTEFYQNQNDDIRIFSNFLSGKYGIGDLLFFLFLRNLIEKELNISFLDKAKDETKIQHKENKEYIFLEFYLNFHQCSKIICQLYNIEDEILINQVIKRIEPYLIKDPQSSNFNQISIYNLLVCLTDDFHNSVIAFNESKGINNVPFVFNKKNEFFDLSSNSDENTHEGFVSMLEYFGGQEGEFEDNLKYILLTYIKEKEILNFFDKYFEGDCNENLENIIYDIRNCVTQKIFLIIEFIFNEDIKSFNVGFGIQPDKKNEDFEELINIKNELINYKEIIQLPEELVEKFCQKLINIPHLVAQISKIIDAKK